MLVTPSVSRRKRKQPKIDFDIWILASFLDVPGLSKIIHNVVVEQISNFAVLPNKITVPLTAEVDPH